MGTDIYSIHYFPTVAAVTIVGHGEHTVIPLNLLLCPPACQSAHLQTLTTTAFGGEFTIGPGDR